MVDLKHSTVAIPRIPARTWQLLANDELLVSINLNDGTCQFGEKYTPDAATKAFWDAVVGERRTAAAAADEIERLQGELRHVREVLWRRCGGVGEFGQTLRGEESGDGRS